VNAAALSGTRLGTPSSGGALKSGAHGYAQAGNEADDVDGEGLSLGDCGIAPLEMNTPSDASTPSARLIGLPKFHPLTGNAQHRDSPSISLAILRFPKLVAQCLKWIGWILQGRFSTSAPSHKQPKPQRAWRVA
jgi:hypothetical protein